MKKNLSFAFVHMIKVEIVQMPFYGQNGKQTGHDKLGIIFLMGNKYIIYIFIYF